MTTKEIEMTDIRIERLTRLHVAEPCTICAEGNILEDCGPEQCRECLIDWPCPTKRILDGEEVA